jgi:kynurenine formamidase
VSSAAFDAMAARVRNWGRWGTDDVLGTLNLIDEAARLRGAASVVSGQALSLSLPLSAAEGIQLGFIKGRTNPTMTMTRINEAEAMAPDGPAFNEDLVTFSMQGATHIDGLAHVSVDGHLYNGYRADEIDEHGSARLGIHHLGAVVTRGVLLDLARARGEAMLPAGHQISVEDLEAAVAHAGLRPMAGDAVVIRTGHMQHLAPGRPLDDPDRDLVAYSWPSPGLTIATAGWFHDHDVALVATDTMVFEAYPCENEEDFLPVHALHLVEMGMTQGQNWMLEELADAAAADGRHAFLLDATPLRFTGAVGSALTPVALR